MPLAHALDNAWDGGAYRRVRALLGAYLVVHFAQLVPYAAELFSDRGALADAALSPLFRLFPSPFWLSDAPAMATSVVVAGALLGVLLALGLADRWAALLLWYLWASLHARMPLIANPSLPFIGFLLLVHAALPQSPSFVRRPQRTGTDFRFDPQLFAVLWIVMALGYSYSGYTKLVSPSWLDGTAIRHVLHNPLARDTPLRELLIALPPPLLALCTWGALAAELLFAPLALLRALRPFLWATLVVMHLGLLTLIDFADLSIAMLVLHAFTFDPAWATTLRERRSGTVARPTRPHGGTAHERRPRAFT